MSTILIRRALEKRLNELLYLPPVAWENTDFREPDGPYIEPILFFSAPDDRGYRDSPFIQRGYMQINLRYPTNTGTIEAQSKAEELRDWFFRGLSLVEEDFVVTIERTPEITKGGIIDDRYVMRVFIRFVCVVQAEPGIQPVLDPFLQEW